MRVFHDRYTPADTRPVANRRQRTVDCGKRWSALALSEGRRSAIEKRSVCSSTGSAKMSERRTMISKPEQTTPDVGRTTVERAPPAAQIEPAALRRRVLALAWPVIG